MWDNRELKRDTRLPPGFTEIWVENEAVGVERVGGPEVGGLLDSERTRIHVRAFIASQPAMCLIGPGPQLLGMVQPNEHGSLSRSGTPTYVNPCTTMDRC